MSHKIIKLAVKAILENANSYSWSLQGFGMLRLYLDTETRLHIWDSRYMIDDVSIIHTHPWHFESLVVAGEMSNQDYEDKENLWNFDFMKPVELYRQLILTGEDAHGVAPIEKCRLAPKKLATYSEGQKYVQFMTTPHRSFYQDGTVTIIDRSARTDKNHAYSYWPTELGEDGWISAAPREATPEEVSDIVCLALTRWF